MPSHWTYIAFDSASDLEQGDILAPTPELRRVFVEVHPHFADEKYVAFLVGTQTCDLVRRGAAPKPNYISLVVVRPLSPQVTSKIFAQVTKPVATGLFRSGDKGEIRRLLERIVNQNEQALGIFFLYQDSDCGVSESSIALLRITVSLRAEHYDTLVAARTGRLQRDFQAKLGWLIGNLYDRPATRDWDDDHIGRQTADELLGGILKENVEWIDDEIVVEADARAINVAALDQPARELLRPPSALERALQEVEGEVKRIAARLPAEQQWPNAEVTKVVNRLRNNGKFKKLLR